jgi:WD40 repeat protein
MRFRPQIWLFFLVGIVVVSASAFVSWTFIRDRVLPNLRLPLPRPTEVQSLAVSPDGAFAAAGHRNGLITVWEPESGSSKVLGRMNSRGAEELAISHDGRYIATGVRWYDQKGGSVGVLDRSANQWIIQREDSSFVPAFAFHPSRPILAYATSDHSISLIDVPSGRETKRLASKRLRPSDLAFSPDGRRLALAALDTQEFHKHSVALWDVDGDRMIVELAGHETWALEMLFSFDGEWLGSIGIGEALIVWNVEAGRLERKYPGRISMPHSLAFARSGSSVFLANGDGSITEWWVKEGTRKKEWVAAKSQAKIPSAMFVRCDPKGRYIAFARGRDVVFMTAAR